ncbi:hypothetical protein [Sphaerisporangium sp. TRM90804]|uniref:hypothetical protein n=1 Tax=Sphaerisporangium sp. TRM90804 TaxID=3031113 RepID=UPI00244C6424|nr:hypothetical protein [Sphaerisporangium sp. TRM90804]MDH2430746.1 hypothetical protein [Sphaerisporangium sp. TRM90804]
MRKRLVGVAVRPAVAVAVIVTAGLTAPPPAIAGPAAARHGSLTLGRDHGPIVVHSGAGKRNQSYVAVYSPTNVRGVQGVSVSVSGKTTMQSAHCRNHNRVCTISQKHWTRSGGGGTANGGGGR